MELELKNRIAFITGASRGIGRAIALALADEGVHLALFGRDLKACEAVARRVRRKHRRLRVAVIPLDFERPREIRTAVRAAAKALGGVDILVNCAGGAFRGRVGEIPDEAWERYFRVKPLGLVRMTRETLPLLKRSRQGRVINISGTRGREPEAHSAMSGPINFGTLSLTKVMANEFGRYGITVNAIAPGSTATQRWNELVSITARERGVSRAAAERHLLREVPLGRVIRPEDVAAAAVFLASKPAELISGCSINVDGGRTRSI